MGIQLKCPNYSKRAMDVIKATKGKVIIEMKCPHCRKIVKINYCR
ncbi:MULTISPECIES: hypothetical protein [Clostridium]|uniref:Uncharacterized protein n=1 Tax=Clostridium carnis TaxID=1530 RepID=A0ABY6SY91_9CLOT|nr:hypothetical protein [Clostridium carnis]CAI3547184.1 conserved hypothetical protein [Clostridium neonatale]CAI3555497.1 conserved hypothetical protein [Clostridium neonatale]CAI3563461.1 conserved hypothetical protein [Clostridium neonatale]CAI3629502.1 conserved hypothetical protein [Clostridium neonatale]CAI3657919.1 conserved hypothetical protein [Clostridium neonatale]